jgi:hypothetical protein
VGGSSLYSIELPMQELMDFHDLNGRVVGDGLITVSGDWEGVKRDVHEGDEILLRGYVDEWPEPVVELHAVVTGLNDEVPGIEVIV